MYSLLEIANSPRKIDNKVSPNSFMLDPALASVKCAWATAAWPSQIEVANEWEGGIALALLRPERFRVVAHADAKANIWVRIGWLRSIRIAVFKTPLSKPQRCTCPFFEPPDK